MFFLPILGNCNLEFRSDIIIFRKPALLTEALVLRKHCMWTQPLHLINLLLCATCKPRSLLPWRFLHCSVYKMTIIHLWLTSIHPLMVSWGQLQSFMYKIGMLLLPMSLELPEVSLCVQMDATCILWEAFAAQSAWKWETAWRLQAYTDISKYVIQKRDSKADSWKPLCLFSVGYTGVCEAHELITSSPFVWDHEENKSALIFLRLLRTCTCLHEVML